MVSLSAYIFVLSYNTAHLKCWLVISLLSQTYLCMLTADVGAVVNKGP